MGWNSYRDYIHNTGSLRWSPFDGALDAHFGIHTTMTESLIVMGVSLLTVVLVMYVTGLIIAKNFRFVDILGTMTLARAPFLILAILSLFTTFPEVEEIMRDPMIFLDYPSTILFMVIAVPVIVWYIALLYNGFKVSTGAKGAKLIIGFVVGILVAEAISKLVLIYGFYAIMISFPSECNFRDLFIRGAT